MSAGFSRNSDKSQGGQGRAAPVSCLWDLKRDITFPHDYSKALEKKWFSLLAQKMYKPIWLWMCENMDEITSLCKDIPSV